MKKYVIVLTVKEKNRKEWNGADKIYLRNTDFSTMYGHWTEKFKKASLFSYSKAAKMIDKVLGYYGGTDRTDFTIEEVIIEHKIARAIFFEKTFEFLKL